MGKTKQAVSAVQVLLQFVPAKHRAKVWDAIIVLGALSTLVVLFLPNSELFGLEVPDRVAAIATGLSTLLGALARANTPNEKTPSEGLEPSNGTLPH